MNYKCNRTDCIPFHPSTTEADISDQGVQVVTFLLPHLGNVSQGIASFIGGSKILSIYKMQHQSCSIRSYHPGLYIKNSEQA